MIALCLPVIFYRQARTSTKDAKKADKTVTMYLHLPDAVATAPKTALPQKTTSAAQPKPARYPAAGAAPTVEGAIPAPVAPPGVLAFPFRRHQPGGQPATTSPCEMFDPVFRFGYQNKREAAVAALLAGDDAENISRRRERALGMFMMSIGRDPSFAPAVFNLGVLSAKMGHWDDALKFYQEARRLDTANQLGDILDAELKRVNAIAQLESTPEGHRQRQFDTSPDPPLLSDNLMYIHVQDDQINNPASDLLLSSQSLFGTYLGRMCATSNTQ
jgi:hypothetical protein